jgi:hypothetical protein
MFTYCPNPVINYLFIQQRVLFYLALTVNTEYNKKIKKDHSTEEDETKMVVLFKVSSLPWRFVSDSCSKLH